MLTTEITLTIPFYDLDPLEIVWHGNYARYFEQARCALLDKIGYNYNAMKESGYSWPVVNLQTKFIRSIHFMQEIVVRATMKEYQNRLRIEYVIMDKQSGKVLTKAETIQVAVHMATRELCLESPEVLLEKMRGVV